MLNKYELLIHGFIHEIENILDNNQIIPLGLIQLLCLFYEVPVKLYALLIERYKLLYTDMEMQSTYTIDLHSQHTLLPFRNIGTSTPCFVPNISQYMNTRSNRHYTDGVVVISAQQTSSSFTLHPCTILVSRTSKKQIVHVSQSTMEYKTGHLMDLFYTPLVHCHNNGIIYLHGSHVYQLPLKDINPKQWNVNVLSQKWNGFVNEHTHSINIGYMENENKLFGIGQYAKSAVFDFGNNKWKETKRLLYHVPTQFGICKKNYYNTKRVYVVSNHGVTAEYDMYTNKWIILYCDEDINDIIDRIPIVWMDGKPDILYCATPDYFGYFDVRDNKRKWNKSDKMKSLYDKMGSEHIYGRLFV